MVEGEEIFGYEPVAVLKPSGEYNDETDLIFYKEPKQSGAVLLKKGDFAIVPPEDAHAPRRMSANGPCRVKKIVVKVKKKKIPFDSNIIEYSVERIQETIDNSADSSYHLTRTAGRDSQEETNEN